MANTLSLTINANWTNATNRTASRSYTGSITTSGAVYSMGIQNIGTSDETVTISPDLSSLGYIYARNLDATNYLELGYTSGTYFAKLKPGEGCVFRAGSGLTTIHAKSNTAACDMESFVISD